MFPYFLDRGPRVREADVSAFEERCGFRLPLDYRQFLLEQNGGRRRPAPRPEEDIAAEGWPRRHQFFSLGAAASIGVTLEEAIAFGWEAIEEWPGLLADLALQMHGCREGGYPRELLPIAVVWHDGLLLLRLDAPDPGEVYFTCDPDGYFEWHCERVAGSFSELLRDFEELEFA